MTIERIGIGHSEIERERLARYLDINLPPFSVGGGTSIENSNSTIWLLLVEHRHPRGQEHRPFVLGGDSLKILNAARARSQLNNAVAVITHGFDQEIKL